MCFCKQDHTLPPYESNAATTELLEAIIDGTEELVKNIQLFVPLTDWLYTIIQKLEDASSIVDINELEGEYKACLQRMAEVQADLKALVADFDLEAVIDLWKTCGMPEEAGRSKLTCLSQAITPAYEKIFRLFNVEQEKTLSSAFIASSKASLDKRIMGPNPSADLALIDTRLSDWKATFEDIDIDFVANLWKSQRANEDSNSRHETGGAIYPSLAREALSIYDKAIMALMLYTRRGGILYGVADGDARRAILRVGAKLIAIEDMVDILDPN